MTRVRRTGIAALLVLVLAPGAWLLQHDSWAVARQEGGAPAIEVGAGPVGEPSLRLVGRVTYGPESVELFGYLATATNLGPELLFAGASPVVDAARFTYVVEIAISGQATRGDVRSIDGNGAFTVYLNDGGSADWTDPASFAAGAPVAEFSLRLQDTLQRQDPAVGVVVGDARLVQERAGEFLLAGEAFRFGKTGLESRLRYTGALSAAVDEGPGVAASVTGSLIVTSREVTPVPLGAGDAVG